MTIRFAEDEVRPMGRAAAGVRGMKMRAERRGRVLRRRPRRRRHPHRHRRRLRQAHPARPVQPAGPRRPGRAGHQAHRQEGLRRRRLHGRPRRRDLRDRHRRHRHPHAGARDLLPGSRRHRRPGHEPHRRRDGRLRGAGPRRRRQRCSEPPSSLPVGSLLAGLGPPSRHPGPARRRGMEAPCGHDVETRVRRCR